MAEEKDISLLVLTILYGYNANSKYVIEPLDKKVIVEKNIFRDFIIKEKKDGKE